MDLNKLKTGKEFICYWFEGREAFSCTCIWREGCESFFKKDETGHFDYIRNENQFFKHTRFIME